MAEKVINFASKWSWMIIGTMLNIILAASCLIYPSLFTAGVLAMLGLLMGIVGYYTAIEAEQQREGAIKVVHTIRPDARIVVVTEKDEDGIVINESEYKYDQRYLDPFRHVVSSSNEL